MESESRPSTGGTRSGESVALSKQDSKATLVIFYLGRTCFHCAKNLKDIAPIASKFEDAGISVLGVSADKPEQLKEAIKNFNGSITFPILSDGDPFDDVKFLLSECSRLVKGL